MNTGAGAYMHYADTVGSCILLFRHARSTMPYFTNSKYHKADITYGSSSALTYGNVLR